ncbi:MAG: hypothetical protein JWM31_1210 [Solirubrobacterales bacterium]|nr:hypothetical protein [Solirubrobacterales bacterium]
MTTAQGRAVPRSPRVIAATLGGLADPAARPPAAPARAPAPDAADPAPDSWLGLWLSLAVVAAAAVLVLVVPELREAAGHALHGQGDALRAQLRDLGAAGVVVLLAVMLIHAVALFPSELVTATAGYVYGFLGALPIVVGGWLASALLTYWLGRHAGRPVLRKLAGGRRLERAEAAVARGGAGVLLAARLIPVVPYSLIGYVAGAARVPIGRFVWTTVVGSLPLSIVVIALGTRLDEFSLSDPIVWLAAVPVLAAGLAGHRMMRR